MLALVTTFFLLATSESLPLSNPEPLAQAPSAQAADIAHFLTAKSSRPKPSVAQSRVPPARRLHRHPSTRSQPSNTLPV
jgi:hypothetical protein